MDVSVELEINAFIKVQRYIPSCILLWEPRGNTAVSLSCCLLLSCRELCRHIPASGFRSIAALASCAMKHFVCVPENGRRPFYFQEDLIICLDDTNI